MTVAQGGLGPERPEVQEADLEQPALPGLPGHQWDGKSSKEPWWPTLHPSLSSAELERFDSELSLQWDILWDTQSIVHRDVSYSQAKAVERPFQFTAE